MSTASGKPLPGTAERAPADSARPDSARAERARTDRPRLFGVFSNKPWATALQYGALSVVIAALGWSGLWDVFSLLPERVSPWYALCTALPASLTALGKRRVPGLCLLLAIALFVIDLCTVGGLVPLLVVLELFHSYLFASGERKRRTVMWQAVVAVALLVIAALMRSGDMQIATMIGLQFGALVGFTYWYANSMAQSSELVALYRQQAESAQRLAALDREAAVQGERDRMARELHDVVAGHISAIAIRSEAALGSSQTGAASETGTAPEQRALRAVRSASLEAHAALRSMIEVLRSGAQDYEVPSGRTRLPELVSVANESGVRVELVDDVKSALTTPVDHAVGKIVQEGLANAVRHSAGAEVRVRLSETTTEIIVEVISRGGYSRQSPALRGSGMGLELLSQRVAALRGEMQAGPDGTNAWMLRASLPKESK